MKAFWAVLLFASAPGTLASCTALDTNGAHRCKTHENCNPGRMCVDGQCAPIASPEQSVVDRPMSVWTDAAPVLTDAGADAGKDASTDASKDASTAATGGASTGAAHDASAIVRDAGPVMCSDEPPPDLSACSIEREVCARWSTDEMSGLDNYFACQCRPKTSTRWVWDCYDLNRGARCPHETQNDGDSCYGWAGSMCPYPPGRMCTCPMSIPGNELLWECVDVETPPDALTAIEPDKLVRDLTSEERQSWCEWLLDASVAPGNPLPPDQPADNSSYYPDTSCFGCPAGIGTGGMIPSALPVSACAANLELSTCGATMAQFNDCIRSMFAGCSPQGQGCPIFFETPGCAGTIASPGAGCGVKIERRE